MTLSFVTLSNLVEQARSDIQVGSKSFAFASAIFSRDQRESCWKLYSWCRRADDAIDDESSPDRARVALAALERNTRAAFRGECSSADGHPWLGLQEIAGRYKLPEKAALDLLRGFAFDVGENSNQSKTQIDIQIADQESLLDYCYCVAGTVGLLMCPIMGVRDPAATRSAIALGSAMQLTNIARDVKEDLLRGRVYLPRTWLVDGGVEPIEILNRKNRAAVLKVVNELLDLAEELYEVGASGIHFLPWRAAWAVQVAAYIYRDIGRTIVRRGAAHNFERVIVGRHRKFVLFILATAELVKNRIVQIPIRIYKQIFGTSEKRNRDGLDLISS